MGSSWRFFWGPRLQCVRFKCSQYDAFFLFVASVMSWDTLQQFENFFSGFQWSKIPGKVGKGACSAGWLADYLIVYALPGKWRKKCSSLFLVLGCNERLFHTHRRARKKTSGLGINVFDVSVVVVAVVIIIVAGWCEITP